MLQKSYTIYRLFLFVILVSRNQSFAYQFHFLCHYYILGVAKKIQCRTFKVILDTKIVDSIFLLKHCRNVSCLTFFYKYFYGHWTFVPLTYFTIINDFQLTLVSNFGRTVNFRDSFFSRTIRICKAQPRSVFPVHCDFTDFDVK